jgi:Tfp pilus assembly protein PilE
MKKKLTRTLENDMGFSLAEMMLVTVLAGIIMAIALPHYGLIVEKSKADEGKQTLNTILSMQKRYFVEHNETYATSLALLDTDIRPLANFSIPTASNDINALGQIVRTGSYTLTIANTGVISCSGGSGGICQKIGF